MKTNFSLHTFLFLFSLCFSFYVFLLDFFPFTDRFRVFIIIVFTPSFVLSFFLHGCVRNWLNRRKERARLRRFQWHPISQAGYCKALSWVPFSLSENRGLRHTSPDTQDNHLTQHNHARHNTTHSAPHTSNTRNTKPHKATHHNPNTL